MRRLFFLPVSERTFVSIGLSMYTSSYVFVATLRNASFDSIFLSSSLHQPHQSLPLNTATTLRPFASARRSAASRSSVKPFGVDVFAEAASAQSAAHVIASIFFICPPLRLR